ncbi:unnamed protein product [Durusdinium trenchii]|uniref:Uncharacterized protein n=1 Tax=Durusdinium trenchii TaxID=1381693 RepID=A0ABP0M3W7_9DINO
MLLAVSGRVGPEGESWHGPPPRGPRALSASMTRATWPGAAPGARALSGRFTSLLPRGSCLTMLAGFAETGRLRMNTFSEEQEELGDSSRLEGTEKRSSVLWLTQSWEHTLHVPGSWYVWQVHPATLHAKKALALWSTLLWPQVQVE